VVFDNVLVVITRNRYNDDILLDGQRLATWSTFRGYAIGWTPVSPEQHFIQVTNGKRVG